MSFSPGIRLSEHAVQLVEQQTNILKHLLFWLQDQPYLRAKWHGAVSKLALFSPGVVEEVDRLIGEVHVARQQFPYGLPPARDTEACTLRSRLSLLKCELQSLRELRVNYQTL